MAPTRGEWRETVRTILDKPGAVVMLGPVDVGKTTVATALANAALRARLPAAVVDADPGQSDIGPPATAALGVPDRPVGRMSEIAPSAAWFVGDTSPRLVAGDLVEGTARLVRRARRQGARVIVVDTAGWVEGPAAVATVLREILGVRPRHVVAIQRGEEVEPILARVPGDIAVHRLPPSPHARPRSRDERRAYREQAFARYFAGARPVSLELLAIPCRRPVRYRGRAIPHGRLLAEVPPEDLRHLLVGLVDRYGWLVALGTVLEVYPSSQRVEVLSPLGSLSRVRALHWGVLRVAPSGREQGRLPLVA
jgi:polynucleotide 5'-hydroxyl-kinase GRC3/NOL9